MSEFHSQVFQIQLAVNGRISLLFMYQHCTGNAKLTVHVAQQWFFLIAHFGRLCYQHLPWHVTLPSANTPRQLAAVSSVKTAGNRVAAAVGLFNLRAQLSSALFYDNSYIFSHCPVPLKSGFYMRLKHTTDMLTFPVLSL